MFFSLLRLAAASGNVAETDRNILLLKPPTGSARMELSFHSGEPMKKAIKAVSILGVMLLGVAASTSALARHGGHVRFGFYFGAPFYAPWHYPAPYYYYPPYYPPAVVTVPSSPPVYIEQGPGAQAAPAPAAQSESYWYYCTDLKAYYPYVKECPAGWMRVVPQPPPG